MEWTEYLDLVFYLILAFFVYLGMSYILEGLMRHFFGRHWRKNLGWKEKDNIW